MGVMFSSPLKIWSIFFLLVSVCTISSSSFTQKTCQNLIDAFKDLTSEEKMDFFEEDELVQKYKFCLKYIGMKDSIEFDDGDSSFGIENEVDNLISSEIYGCLLSLYERNNYMGEEIKFPGYGKWVSRKTIKSLRTRGPCCFR